MDSTVSAAATGSDSVARNTSTSAVAADGATSTAHSTSASEAAVTHGRGGFGVAVSNTS